MGKLSPRHNHGRAQDQPLGDHETRWWSPGSSKMALSPVQCLSCPPGQPPPWQGRRSRLQAALHPALRDRRTSVRGMRGADPNVPQAKRDCKARRGPARGQVQRNCWCLERQSPLGLVALSHHRDSQEIQLLQPSRTALLQPSRSPALTPWGPRTSGALAQWD